MIILLFSIVYLFNSEISKLALVFIIIILLVVLWSDLKSIAEIKLFQRSMQLIYHPFFKPEIFEYNLSKIDEISMYYSWKRYHSTIHYIKLKGDPVERKHTTAMSVNKSKELVLALRSMEVNVLELDWPK
ncbi:MAG: hypothetical protein ABI851_10295 [Saprospiraceae bacterium]